MNTLLTLTAIPLSTFMNSVLPKADLPIATNSSFNEKTATN